MYSGYEADRDAYGFLQRSYQLGCVIRKQKACHILDTDGICTHILDSLCHILPVIQCISVAQRVGKRYLRMSFFLICSLNGCLQIAQIVQTVKDTDNINTVCDGFLYEIFYYVVCIRTVTKNVLSTEQHLQLRVL